MKHKLLTILYFLGFWLGITRLFYYFNRNNQRILTYHNIIEDTVFDETSPCMGVSHAASVFAYQMKSVKKYLKPSLTIGEPASFVVTFDDGYANNFHHAYDILEHENIKGIFFVPLDIIDSREPLWIDKILMWASYVPAGKYTLFESEISITDNRSRHLLFERLWNIVLENYSQKEAVIESLENSYPFNKIPLPDTLKKTRFYGLSSDNLEVMKNSGHLIAAHAVHHDILSLLDKESLSKDIASTEKQLNDTFNTKIYAYPFGGRGEVGEREIEALSKSEFTMAFVNTAKPDDFRYCRYAVPRFSLPNTTNPYIIHAKMSGLEYFLKHGSMLPCIKDLL